MLPVEQFASAMLFVPDLKARLRGLKNLRATQNKVNERRQSDSALARQRRPGGGR